MKFFSVLFLGFLLSCGSLLQAQPLKRPYSLFFGINAVDTRTSADGSSTFIANHFNDFFSVRDHWNYLAYSFNVRYATYISPSVTFGISVSMNSISKYVTKDATGSFVVTDPGLVYNALDASITYSFRRLLGLKLLDPSIMVGGGKTLIGDNSFTTFNSGAGLTFWMTPLWGLEFSTKYKKSFGNRDIGTTPENPSHFQHTAGLVFKLERKNKPKNTGPSLPDFDGDGVADQEDICPKVAGVAIFKGCPDTDGDFVSDEQDECPTLAGVVYFKGCPDTDADGIADTEDDCPTVKGVVFAKGCPESLAEETARQKREALSSLVGINTKTNLIFFATGSARFNSVNVIAYLDAIASYMKNYDKVRFRIDGHTDSVGSKAGNTKLSLARANAIRRELIARGLKPEAVQVQGYGSSKPIAPNDTEAGRIQNRRIEIVVLP